jgi:hypothetical protein
MILGENYARMIGLDLPALREAHMADEFGGPDRALRAPWTAWTEGARLAA